MISYYAEPATIQPTNDGPLIVVGLGQDAQWAEFVGLSVGDEMSVLTIAEAVAVRDLLDSMIATAS